MPAIVLGKVSHKTLFSTSSALAAVSVLYLVANDPYVVRRSPSRHAVLKGILPVFLVGIVLLLLPLLVATRIRTCRVSVLWYLIQCYEFKNKRFAITIEWLGNNSNQSEQICDMVNFGLVEVVGVCL